MSFEKKSVVDRIEVLESGCVNVRTRIFVMENGQQISSTFHRHVVTPGDEYSVEDARVQEICLVTHTASVIAAYKAAIAAKGV